MLYEKDRIEAEELDAIFDKYKDNIIIAVSPSYHYESDKGSYRVCLIYKKHRKYLHEDVSGLMSANKCAIKGLIKAAEQIKMPKPVSIVVASSFGFDKAIRGKGVNANLWRELFIVLQEKECPKLTEIFVKNGSNAISRLCTNNP